MSVRPPCKGCEFRRVGCHDGAACSRWADYLKKREAEQAAMPRPEDVDVLRSYIRDRTKRYGEGK